MPGEPKAAPAPAPAPAAAKEAAAGGAAKAPGDDKEECAWCKFMKAGGCGGPFEVRPVCLSGPSANYLIQGAPGSSKARRRRLAGLRLPTVTEVRAAESMKSCAGLTRAHALAWVHPLHAGVAVMRRRCDGG